MLLRFTCAGTGFFNPFSFGGSRKTATWLPRRSAKHLIRYLEMKQGDTWLGAQMRTFVLGGGPGLGCTKKQNKRQVRQWAWLTGASSYSSVLFFPRKWYTCDTGPVPWKFAYYCRQTAFNSYSVACLHLGNEEHKKNMPAVCAQGGAAHTCRAPT